MVFINLLNRFLQFYCDPKQHSVQASSGSLWEGVPRHCGCSPGRKQNPRTCGWHLQQSCFLPGDTNSYAMQNTALPCLKVFIDQQLQKNQKTLALILWRATPRSLHSLCGPWPWGLSGRWTALAKSSAWEVQKLLFPVCIQWRRCREWTQSDLQHFKVQETKAWKSNHSLLLQPPANALLPTAFREDSLLLHSTTSFRITSYIVLLFRFQLLEASN